MALDTVVTPTPHIFAISIIVIRSIISFFPYTVVSFMTCIEYIIRTMYYINIAIYVD
ncbi:hypothetical protein GCM10008013_27860 [Paenibacillus segetis]|uniref:Uncharacterized protein n=1 Tax=Paenibacillus segetis TaxID=1325360 RepID=A0ABQ1YIK3_9BACL|nr:hypothetical protein GCM10008013_27860 [Paenibacillus segetis]